MISGVPRPMSAVSESAAQPWFDAADMLGGRPQARSFGVSTRCSV